MKAVGIEDLVDGPGSVLEDGAIVLLADGEGRALVIGLGEGEDPCRLEGLIRQARAQAAVSRIREKARAGEAGLLAPDTIDGEIQAARRARSRAVPPP